MIRLHRAYDCWKVSFEWPSPPRMKNHPRVEGGRTYVAIQWNSWPIIWKTFCEVYRKHVEWL